MDEFDDDDYRDLYADVEVQVSSAINVIQASTQLHQEENEVYGNGDENAGIQELKEGAGGVNAEAGEEIEKEGAEGEEDGNKSECESENDFNIVLNDDKGKHNANGDPKGGEVGFLKGNGGKVGKDEECGIEEEDEGNYGIENSGSSCGGQRGSGGRGGSGDGYNSQYKRLRSNSVAFSSNLKSNASGAVAFYSSTFARGHCKNDVCTYQFGTRLIGSQRGRNFALPRSRTIFDVNIDALEQKRWRNPWADITDFFNFGFDEDSWKSYCSHLDRHRKLTTKVTASTAYQHGGRIKDHKVGFEHEVVRGATEKNVVHCNQKRAVSLTNAVSCGQPQSEMLKGRAIQVEDGLGERQQSVDIRLSVERDSDVIIEIPLQDLDRDSSYSDKVAFDTATDFLHKVAESRDAAVDYAGDMLCSSASEDELPILEGPTERTGKIDPHRCSRHSSVGDGDPSCLDSGSHSSLYVSDANEEQLQVMECDSEGLAEETKASDEPEGSVEQGKPTTTSKGTPESSHSEQSQRSQNSSPYQCDYVGSRCDAYEDPYKFHDHSKRGLPKSASKLRESSTFDYHSSKDSRNHGISMMSSDFKNIARSRSPVKRNIKYKKRRSIKGSGSKNHLGNRSAFNMSDAEKLYDAHYPAVSAYRERNRHHHFDSYEEKDYFYKEELEQSLSYKVTRFPSKAGSDLAEYPHGKDNQYCGYKQDRYPGRNVNRKQVMVQKWNRCRKEVSIEEMDYSNYDASRRSVAEQSPYLDNVNHTRSERRADELHFKRRTKNDDFSSQCNYGTEYMQENYQPMPYNGRERDYIENIYDRQLRHSRREVMRPLKSRRRYGSPIHDYEGIWFTDCEEVRSRYARHRLSFCSNRECRTAGRVRRRAAPFSRNGVSERHGKWRRQDDVERYRGSNKLAEYADGYINGNESIQDTGDHDNFVGRRQYWQSEVLHWLEEESSSRHQENIFEGEETSYPSGRTSGYKIFDYIPGSGNKEKLIDIREPDERRYKLPTESNRFDRSSDTVHKDILGQALPSCWDSTDSHVDVGDGKSSRCLKPGSRNGRYDFLDWNNDPKRRSSNAFKELHLKKVVQGENTNIIGLQDDANWRGKHSDKLQNDSLDIEEGQIVTEDLNKKPVRKASVSRAAAKFISVNKFPGRSAIHQSAKVEELETSRIVEIVAKMEKRRERFQQPITLKKVSGNQCKPFADSNAQTAEAKVQRPARKRKWDGS